MLRDLLASFFGRPAPPPTKTGIVKGPVSKPAPARTQDVSTGAGFPLAIVGESNYQGAIRHADLTDPERDRIVTVTIQREPSNSYDANAVVVLNADGRTLGYFSREDAIYYQSVLQAAEAKGLQLTCRAKLTGATGRKLSYGVVLDVPSPDRMLAVIVGDDDVQPF